MRGRKVTVLIAVAVMLVSGSIGATVLRSPDATALDSEDIVEAAESELDAIEETTLEAPAPSSNGVNETLVLVVAAQVPPVQAQTKLNEINAAFGELQGFAVDASDNYEVTGAYVPASPAMVDVPCVGDLECPEGVAAVRELQPVDLRYVPGEQIGSLAGEALGGVLDAGGRLSPGNSLIVTAFRTKKGAEEFIALARAAGLMDVVTLQVRKLGGGDIGLGQELNPDGSGPLTEPLPGQELYQH
jgi:hypothetical protein